MHAQAQHANVAAQTLQAKLVEINQAQAQTAAATNAATNAVASARSSQDDIARTLSEKSKEVNKVLLLNEKATNTALEQTAKMNDALAQSEAFTKKLHKGLTLQAEKNLQTQSQLAIINSKAAELTASAKAADQARDEAQEAVEKADFENVSRRAALISLQRLSRQISQIRPENGRVFSDKITPALQKFMGTVIERTIDELAEPAQAEAAFSISS